MSILNWLRLSRSKPSILDVGSTASTIKAHDLLFGNHGPVRRPVNETVSAGKSHLEPSSKATATCGSRLVKHYEFNTGATDVEPLIEGWAAGEDVLWCKASGGKLKISRPDDEVSSSYIVVFRIGPFLDGCSRKSRSIQIVVNEADVTNHEISGDTALAIAIPRSLGEIWAIEIHASDHVLNVPLCCSVKAIWVFACRDDVLKSRGLHRPPLHGRSLSETVSIIRRESGLTPQQLLNQFESLGHSCDFGFVQRDYGLEPIGLFRWSGISTVDAFRGITEKFSRIGSAQSVDVIIPDGLDEFWIFEKNYGIFFHTFQSPKTNDQAAVLEKEAKRLPFLRRKFIEELELTDKIFFLKRPEATSDAEALAVWAALNLWGRNCLMVVGPHEKAILGAVDDIGLRLARGYVFSELDNERRAQVWLSTCANAYEALGKYN